MEESFLNLAGNELQKELLKAVKALKGQVVNQNSLSVGIEWKKTPQTVKKDKTGHNINKEEMLKKVCREMANCHLCPLRRDKKKHCFRRWQSPCENSICRGSARRR